MKQMAIAVSISGMLAIAAVRAYATPALTTFIPAPGWTEDEWNLGFTLNPASRSIGSADETGLPPDQSASSDLIDESVLPDGESVSGSSGAVVTGSGQPPGGFANGPIYPGAANSDTTYVVPKDRDRQPFATLPGESVRDIAFDSGRTYGGDMLMASGSRITPSDRASLLATDGGGATGFYAVLGARALFAGGMSISSEGGGMIGAIRPTGIATGVSSGMANSGMVIVAPQTFISNDLTAGGFFGASDANAIPASGYSQFVASGGAPAFISDLPGNLSSGWLPPAAPSVSTPTTDLSPSPIRNVRAEDGIAVDIQQISEWLRRPSNLLLAGTFLAVLGGLGSLRRRD